MEYKVATSWFCYSAGHKARKIETYLNDMAKDGWRVVALDAVTVLGFDIGYYLVVGRESRSYAGGDVSERLVPRLTDQDRPDPEEGGGTAEQADAADEAQGGTRTAS